MRLIALVLLLATQAVAQPYPAKPVRLVVGYTVLIASPSSILVNPVLTPKNPFKPLTELAPVSKVTTSPLVVAKA